MTEDTPATQITTAKINAIQAIVVALITTVGAFLIGSAGGRPPDQIAQHWLTLEGVEGTGIDGDVRIGISVNGVNYSYPATAIWAEVRPGMSKQQFPLPIGTDSYSVRFTAFITTRGEILEQTSQEVQTIELTQIPSGNRTYELFPRILGTRDGDPTLRVIYSIQERA